MPNIDLGETKIRHTVKGSGDTLVILPDNLITAQAYQQKIDRDTEFLRTMADRDGNKISEGILNAISCPTLLAGHLGDPVLPGLAAECARLNSLIPDCSLYLSSKTNHPYLGRPFLWRDRSAFYKVSKLFLSRISSNCTRS